MKYIKQYEAVNIGSPKSGDYIVVTPKTFDFKPETIKFISHLIGTLSITKTTCGVNYYFSAREYNNLPEVIYKDIKIYVNYDGLYNKIPNLYIPIELNEIVLWSNNKKDLTKNIDLYLSSLKFNV